MSSAYYTYISETAIHVKIQKLHSAGHVEHMAESKIPNKKNGQQASFELRGQHNLHAIQFPKMRARSFD